MEEAGITSRQGRADRVEVLHSTRATHQQATQLHLDLGLLSLSALVRKGSTAKHTEQGEPATTSSLAAAAELVVLDHRAKVAQDSCPQFQEHPHISAAVVEQVPTLSAKPPEPANTVGVTVPFAIRQHRKRRRMVTPTQVVVEVVVVTVTLT